MTCERPPGGICLECERYVHWPSCPSHPAEPLLDPRGEAVVDMLRVIDDRRRVRLFSQRTIGAGLATLLAVVGVAVLTDQVAIAIALSFSLVAASTVLARRQARKRFQPRFGQWAAEDRDPELTAEEIAVTEPHEPRPEGGDLFSLLR